MRMIQIGDEIVSELKLFDWCLRHIDGTQEVTEIRRSTAEDSVTKSHAAPQHRDGPEQVKPAAPAPRRPPARFSPEVIDFE